MIEQIWQSVIELMQDGGYVMGAIFLLSLCIYTLAFRTWLTSQAAAMPLKQVKDGLLPIHKLPGKSKYWTRFKTAFQRNESDASLRLHYLTLKKSRFQRTLGSQLTLLKTLAAAAPLLGLLGTLVGMIDTFDALSSDRSGDTASMVAGGISKALLTTNAGLIVAIPAIVISYLAKRKLEQALLVFTALQNAIKTQAGSLR